MIGKQSAAPGTGSPWFTWSTMLLLAGLVALAVGVYSALDGRFPSNDGNAGIAAPTAVAAPTQTAAATATPTVVPTATPSTHTITGTLTLGFFASFVKSLPDESECAGMPGYDDIGMGAQEFLRDGDDRLLAVATLGPGKSVEQSTDKDGFTWGKCEFTFVWENVPDSAFYVVTSGRRSGPAYTRDELSASGWTVAMTLGD